ncbi:hypothetical protein [Pararhizobium sp.]|uniref:hypothetical protein n=1 Tax=Pararhizobium sp. TaxID=1977563 RepID=UPI003D127430
MADLPFWLVIVAPPALMIGIAVAERFGLGRAFSISLSAFALAGGVWVLTHSVNASCVVNESECIGATGTAYLIGFFWLMAATLSVASILRAGVAGKLGSESTH